MVKQRKWRASKESVSVPGKKPKRKRRFFPERRSDGASEKAYLKDMATSKRSPRRRGSLAEQRTFLFPFLSKRKGPSGASYGPAMICVRSFKSDVLSIGSE